MNPVCLVAEESIPIIHHLRRYAEQCGFHVMHVSEGESALVLAHKIAPVFILLNTSLPGKIRGWEVLHILKTDVETCKIPVVTYFVNEDTEDSCIQSEANATFQMPVLYESFCQLLSQAGVVLVDKERNTIAKRR